jgi:hypothetical protein
MLPSTLATATHRLLQVGLDRDSNKASVESGISSDAPRKTIKPTIQRRFQCSTCFHFTWYQPMARAAFLAVLCGVLALGGMNLPNAWHRALEPRYTPAEEIGR